MLYFENFTYRVVCNECIYVCIYTYILCRSILALMVYIQGVKYLGTRCFYYICGSVFSIT